jgi:two-component system, NtrC family, sensor histidine kinase HydH
MGSYCPARRLYNISNKLRQPSARPWLAAVLIGMILSISWLDWATGPGREPADLYDIPILFSAAAFGIPGVLVTSTACTAIYGSTLLNHHVPYSIVDVSQVLLFFVLGLAVAQLVTEYLRVYDLREKLLQLNANLERRVAEAVAAEREAQQNLRDGQRLTMLGQATAQIAHEIKNPLVSIGGFASRIQRQLNPDHPAHSALNIIVQEVTKLEKLLKELLDLGRPSRRKTGPVEVNILVHEVLSLAQPLIQDRGVTLHSLCMDGPLTTTGDEDHLRRAILNVVLNGVEAMHEGGKLTIAVSSVFKDGMEGVNIDVQDTGTGIPSEDLSKIFNPFFSTKSDGSGLGLAVVKKTIDTHGGTVQVESRPQRGTSFKIWLPVRKEE